MDAERQTTGGGIRIVAPGEVKVVQKPWGWEKWLADGQPAFPYALKVIHIRAPHKTSLQFHRYKQESNHLLSGSALLHYVAEPIDTERYTAGGYSPDDLRAFLDGLIVRRFQQGETVHVWPGMVHRIEARDEDITLLEASTTELDDVFRLQDDALRGHGRIGGEHA